MTDYAALILEEVDDDYGCPTARWRKATDFAPGVLVEDMGGGVWMSVHDVVSYWESMPGSWYDYPDHDFGMPLKPDRFYDPFA